MGFLHLHSINNDFSTLKPSQILIGKPHLGAFVIFETMLLVSGTPVLVTAMDTN